MTEQIPSIRVMTYNVHSCVGTDKKLSVERVAEVIEDLKPDIVALQELDVGLSKSGGAHQPDLIAEQIGMHSHFFSSVEIAEGQFGNALLSRFPIHVVKSDCFFLPLTNFRRVWFEKVWRPHVKPRGATLANIETPIGRVSVANTHLGLFRHERNLQVRAMLGEDWLNLPDLSEQLVVLGDFNLGPNSDEYRLLAEAFVDAQTVVPGREPEKTFPSHLPLRRIDHMFLRGDLRVRNVFVPRRGINHKASDHLPVVADLERPVTSGGDI